MANFKEFIEAMKEFLDFIESEEPEEKECSND